MSESARRIVWGVGTPRTLRVHWALHELGLAYETRPIQSRTGETLTSEFTALNARQKIPVLQDGELTLTESAAIVTYLSDRYAAEAQALVPRETVARAQCLEACFFVLSELDATTLYVIRRHEGLPHIYGEAPAANVAARSYFLQQMRTIERLLADERPFLLGMEFTAADLLLCTCLSWARACGIALSERVRTYQRGLTARQAYVDASARNAVPARAPLEMP